MYKWHKLFGLAYTGLLSVPSFSSVSYTITYDRSSTDTGIQQHAPLPLLGFSRVWITHQSSLPVDELYWAHLPGCRDHPPGIHHALTHVDGTRRRWENPAGPGGSRAAPPPA